VLDALQQLVFADDLLHRVAVRSSGERDRGGPGVLV